VSWDVRMDLRVEKCKYKCPLTITVCYVHEKVNYHYLYIISNAKITKQNN